MSKTGDKHRGSDAYIVRRAVAEALGNAPHEVARERFIEIMSLQSSKSIGELSPLSGLGDLEELYLCETQITDLSPLRPLTNLRKPNLYHSNVREDDAQKLRDALPDILISLFNPAPLGRWR